MNKTTNIPALRFPGFSQPWIEKKLGDVALKIQDGTHFSPKLYEKGDYLYISSKNIKNGYIDLNNKVYVKKDAHENIYKRCDVIKGDVLLTKDGTIGQVCVNTLEEQFSMLSSAAFLRPKSDMNNYFIYHLLISSIGQKEIGKSIAGQALKRITLSKINSFKYYFPTLPEQQKIADFLSAIDTKIEKLSRKKELMTEYKKGVMQKIFSQKIRFKDESGNHYPDWQEKKLGEVCENPMYGMNSAATEFDGVHKYLRITDIDDSSRTFMPNPLTSPLGFIDEKYKLKEGDILFTRTGASVGKSYLYKKSDGDLYFAGFLIKFSITEADPYFVYIQTLNEEYNKWVKLMSMRSGQPGINSNEYSQLNLQIPCLQEQKKIAEFLTNLDTKIEQINTELEAVKEFKKGLLQKMFV